MPPRPDVSDLRLIGLYLGRILTGLAFVMVLPVGIALVRGEWNALSGLVIAAALCVAMGQVAELRLASTRPLTWAHGTVIVAVAWLLGPLLAAVPFALSGHAEAPIDAVFEAVSGLTTSGLTVLEDLDHLAWSLSVYRHLLHFLGGQGIVIVMLSLLTRGGMHVATLYVSEARDERIMPNLVRTARFIWVVAGTYLVIGTVAMTVAMLLAGLSPGRALGHGFTVFLAAFDTGGFTPTSQSIGYYHSAAVEVVALVLMVAGALSFGLHAQLWRGRRRELLMHLETRSLAVTLLTLTVAVVVGLAAVGTMVAPLGLLRTGFFSLVSAHTGTGFAVVPGATLVADWGLVAPAALVIAMGLGGMASSTAGGIKAFRVGLITKGLVHEVRRLLAPENALIVTTYHAHGPRVLRPKVLLAAVVIVLLYLITYLGGGLVGLAYGRWGIEQTLFESVSATANVGLTAGITSPQMPFALKLVLMVQMWLGRLEFLAAFALVGYVGSLLHRRA